LTPRAGVRVRRRGALLRRMRPATRCATRPAGATRTPCLSTLQR